MLSNKEGGEESQARFCRAPGEAGSQRSWGGGSAEHDWEEAKVQAWRLPPAPRAKTLVLGSPLEVQGCKG